MSRTNPIARATPTPPRRRRWSCRRQRSRPRRSAASAASPTTFNEIDLHNVMDIRARYKEKFEKTYGVGLGFMSFFAKACVLSLKEFPKVNASIDGDDIVYHDYVHL